ncbi:MAG TPA: manganese-dependent inorganic pyrophosphatase [Candidatus Dormibacteraeota bacterium]|nr:manganese-dependent inorganic pyrophosphatase [Candidatus Dormibacteraeota bacterium]
MGKTLIFGHKKPDTDSICSALAYADLKTKLGLQAEAARLGAINSETKYVLEYFKVEAPMQIERVADDVKEVILVDHNEFQQSVDNIKDVSIVEVIDHHRIANFETQNPLYFRAEPVGCTATIIKKMYKENDISIPKEIAGLLLSAIISDTLLLKSPTCTQEDVDAAHELSDIAGVDLETYGLAMLKAGTDLAGKPVSELISMDSKEFTMGGKKVEIAQINVVDVEEVFVHLNELKTEISRVIKEKDLALFLLVVTDILANDSDIYALGNDQDQVEDAFGIKLSSNRAFLEGVVSRKKQIVTELTNSFEK